MNYKTYADLSIDILQEIHKIPQGIHLVVGVPRSGMIPAYMIATQLNLPVLSLDRFIEGGDAYVGLRPMELANKGAKINVLIVDDSVYAGKAMQRVKQQLQLAPMTCHYTFCAVYSSTLTVAHVDFYFKHLPQPRAFQWNYKNCFNVASQACYDIDGVLCVDPTDAENDDGEAYLEFLKTALPLFIPKHKIPCLVTSRLEKYRKETEDWLTKHGVAYDELVMLDLPSAKARRALQIHAKHKASIYAKRKEQLFVESNWNQAKEIFKLANKPVFCTQNDVLINNVTDIAFYENTVTYAGRHFKDVFSEDSKLSLQMQNLRCQYNERQLEIEKLQKKIKKLETNKWIKFSKLNRIEKIKFLINEIKLSF